MTEVHLLKLSRYPIFKQLQLEEALLRTDHRNWCLINDGTSPAIVMGISGSVEKMINQKQLEESPIPVIRRFSGGGTVIVDHDTIFSTFIFNRKSVDVSCCPRNILHWTAQIYSPFLEHCNFQIRENDYALGDRKFGGNAQYMSKNRWLHHTSLLWDYDPEKMNYLLFPPKVPDYRGSRAHTDFLCKLKDHISDKQAAIQSLIEQLEKRFILREVFQEEILEVLERPHRRSTSFISFRP